MTSTYIAEAISEQELSAVRALLEEYAEIRGYDAALGDYKTEFNNLGKKYGPPEGCLLLATYEGRPAGCVAFQQLEPQICEMKRMFVSPDFRGKGIGRKMGEELLEMARKRGFRVMRLDSHPHMHAAQTLYQSLGFYEIGRYNQNPTPGIRFFERMIA